MSAKRRTLGPALFRLRGETRGVVVVPNATCRPRNRAARPCRTRKNGGPTQGAGRPTSGAIRDAPPKSLRRASIVDGLPVQGGAQLGDARAVGMLLWRRLASFDHDPSVPRV